MNRVNVCDLFTGHDHITGQHIYYQDEEGTKPYNGVIFEYFEGLLSSESEVKDGYITGIEKIYYSYTGELKAIYEMNFNTINGIAKEFYKNGKIKNHSVVINNLHIYAISYDEEGNTTEIFEMQPDDTDDNRIKELIPIYREKYKLVAH